MADMNQFTLKIITPERVFYQDEVEMVEFNTTEGEVGIYARHVPTTLIVSPGILTITKDGAVKNAALHAGFAEILQDRVTILAEIIEWPDEIDLKRAESAYNRAKERLEKKSGDIDVIRAEIALKKSLARINVLK